MFSGAADKPAAIVKNKVFTLANEISRTAPEVVRLVAREEAKAKSGDAFRLRGELQDMISRWRSSGA